MSAFNPHSRDNVAESAAKQLPADSPTRLKHEFIKRTQVDLLQVRMQSFKAEEIARNNLDSVMLKML